MSAWWEELLVLEKFFYFIAVPSTVILFLQFLLSILGIASDTDVDLDVDVDGEPGVDVTGEVADFRFVSFRGIIAFLTIFGWVGIVLASRGVPTAITLLIATLCGTIAMTTVAVFFYLVSKLQSNGNLDYNKAIGQLAEVYIPIPEKRTGYGKVQVNIQNQLIEADAISDMDVVLKTGELVRVTDILNKTIMVVEKEN